MTMRKMLLILALVLFAFAVSAAAQTEQELVSIPALSAGFGPSLQAANMSFRLAAFAQDANGVKIPCSAMSSYAGKEFFIPRTALAMPAAELKAAYSVCLTQAHTAANNTMVVPLSVGIPIKGGTITATTQKTTTIAPTPTTTIVATTATAVRDLEQKLKAAQTRLSELRAAAEKRFTEIRAEERKAAEKREKDLQAEFERQLAAAQAAAGKGSDSRLEKRVRELEKENETLKNQLSARDNPPSPSTDWDGLLKAAGLKHHVKKVVQDPQLLAAKQAAEKRISELQLKGRTSPCALLLSLPKVELPSEFSMYQSMGEVSRADCEAAAANTTKEVEVLGWNPIAVVGYPLLFAALALAWPGYRALQKFLNPAVEVKNPKPPVLDMDRVRSIKDDPANGLQGEVLERLLTQTLQNSNIAIKIIGESVWLRADNQTDLLRAIRKMEVHPSFVPGRVQVRDEAGMRFYWMVFQKYNSTTPGDAIKVS